MESEEAVMIGRFPHEIRNYRSMIIKEVLFLEPTVEFVQDSDFICLDGDYLDRFVEAKRMIKEKLSIDTKW